MSLLATLQSGKCTHQTQALDEAALVQYLQALPDWRREGQHIARTYSFRNYYQTLAFVNALAYVVHQQDHHPELTVTYNRCTVRFDTHSVGGLSANDFICAAKADQLFAAAPA